MPFFHCSPFTVQVSRLETLVEDKRFRGKCTKTKVVIFASEKFDVMRSYKRKKIILKIEYFTRTRACIQAPQLRPIEFFIKLFVFRHYRF